MHQFCRGYHIPIAFWDSFKIQEVSIVFNNWVSYKTSKVIEEFVIQTFGRLQVKKGRTIQVSILSSLLDF